MACFKMQYVFSIFFSLNSKQSTKMKRKKEKMKRTRWNGKNATFSTLFHFKRNCTREMFGFVYTLYIIQNSNEKYHDDDDDIQHKTAF